MNLSAQKTERFYRIWFPLLSYVNAHRQIVSDFPAAPGEGNVNTQDALKIRQVLWESNWVSFKRWVRFLVNTNRIAWGEAEAMQRFLKQRP